MTKMSKFKEIAMQGHAASAGRGARLESTDLFCERVSSELVSTKNKYSQQNLLMACSVDFAE